VERERKRKRAKKREKTRGDWGRGRGNPSSSSPVSPRFFPFFFARAPLSERLEQAICFNIRAENPLLGSTVLNSSKTIEEKPTIAFVTDLLASEQLSAVMLA